MRNIVLFSALVSVTLGITGHQGPQAEKRELATVSQSIEEQPDSSFGTVVCRPPRVPCYFNGKFFCLLPDACN